MTTRAEREQSGRRAEMLAAWFLRLKGWRILARRVKTPRGEVDLIARRAGTVAFVEVKWRKRREELDLAIDAWRLRRVAAAAEALVPRYAHGADTVRIDVVLLASRSWPRHIANAWMA